MDVTSTLLSASVGGGGNVSATAGLIHQKKVKQRK